MYGDSAPSLTTVKYWTAELKCNCTKIFNAERLGDAHVKPSKSIKRIYDIVINDQKLKVPEIAETVSISIECL